MNFENVLLRRKELTDGDNQFTVTTLLINLFLNPNRISTIWQQLTRKSLSKSKLVQSTNYLRKGTEINLSFFFCFFKFCHRLISKNLIYFFTSILQLFVHCLSAISSAYASLDRYIINSTFGIIINYRSYST